MTGCKAMWLGAALGLAAAAGVMAQSAAGTDPAPGLVPVTMMADASKDVPSPVMPSGNGPWVVRAYFDSDAPLNLLLRRAAAWNVNRREGVLTIDVPNRFEYQRLINEGFRVAIDEELTQQWNNPVRSLPGQVNGIAGFTCYRTVEETFAAADAIVTAHGDIAQIIDIGDSWAKTQNAANGYDLKVLRLTNRSIAGPKPILFLQGAIHAREYVTAETVTRFGEWLANQYGTNPDVTWVLDHNEVQLLMVANPDGRKVAEISSTQQQRKNRNLNFCGTGGTSVGVDMNRNYPFDWAGPGSSSSPCADNFRGPSAASEIESAAIIAHLRAIFPDQRAENASTPGGDLTTPVSLDATGIYMDVHSNAASTWYSWGNNSTPAPNATQLATLGRKISFFNGYTPEPGVNGGAIGGATDDFTYGTLGVPAFTIEMDGTPGFFPSCTQFESSIVQKNLNAFWMAAKLVRAPLRLPAGPELTTAAAAPSSITSASSSTITVQAADNRFSTLGGTEASQTVASVQVYLTPPWQVGATALGNMTASDGSFNSAVESATYTLPGSALASGKQLVYLQATDSAGNRGPVAAVFVTRSSSGGLSINSGTVNFGNVTAGFTSAASTVTLSNEGSTTLTVSALSATTAPFNRTAEGTCSTSVPFDLAAGGSCTLTYTFSPTGPGAVTQNLALTVTGGAGSGTISLSGTGVQGVLNVSSGSVNFGSVEVGTSSAEQTLTLGNTGNTIINISALTAAAAPFSRVSGGTCSNTLPFTVLAGSSCTLRYNFSPTAAGAASQLISITSSGASNGSFTLQGSGFANSADPIFANGLE